MRAASWKPPSAAPLLGAAALLSALALLAVLGCGERQPPNVLLVTLDTTRADYLGSYGRPGRPTPSLDAIAREGTLFERVWATSATTPVSHASILTGLNPYRHGVRVIAAASGYRLDPSIPTLTTLLAERGYTTAAVHSSFTVSGTFGFGHGFDHFDELAAEMTRAPGDEFVDWDLAAYQRRADETTSRVIALLDRLPEPFFLWIHYWDPHDEFRLPPRAFLRPGAARTGSDALYAEEIRFMDREIGRVVDYLRARNRLEDTLTVVTADHGQGLSDGLAEHGWRGHRMVYRQQLHVPLILRGPGVPAGGRVATPVRTIDVLPTVLDLVGLTTPAGLDGASLAPLLAGREDPAAPRIAYAEQLNGYDWNARMVRWVPTADFLYAVSDGAWKLIYRPSRPERSELFDLEADPEERRNLFAARPEQAQRLLGELARRAPFVDRPFPAGGAGLTDAERQGLVALGYADDRERGDAAPAWGWRCPAGGAITREPGTCPGGTPPVLVARPADDGRPLRGARPGSAARLDGLQTDVLSTAAESADE